MHVVDTCGLQSEQQMGKAVHFFWNCFVKKSTLSESTEESNWGINVKIRVSCISVEKTQ